jgi:hypothetical protein
VICPACRTRFRALLVTIGDAKGVDLLTMACQLEPSLRVEAPRSPSTFEAQAAAVKRPSGSMPAVRLDEAKTDPAPPRESDR